VALSVETLLTVGLFVVLGLLFLGQRLPLWREDNINESGLPQTPTVHLCPNRLHYYHKLLSRCEDLESEEKLVKHTCRVFDQSVMKVV